MVERDITRDRFQTPAPGPEDPAYTRTGMTAGTAAAQLPELLLVVPERNEAADSSPIQV